MIAMVAGSDDMRGGPIPIALAHAGFEAREMLTTDDAGAMVGLHGADDCVLVVEARSLGRRAGSASWSGFLSRHRGVPAVVVTHGETPPELEVAARGRHRILLENPFDAAAVVAAVRQVSSDRRFGAPAERTGSRVEIEGLGLRS